MALNLKTFTTNCKLKTQKGLLHVRQPLFCAQRLYQYPYFVLPSIVVLRNRKAIKELSLWPFFIIMRI